MGPRQDLILIDTNIFIIDLRYKRDIYQKTNREFLDYIGRKKNGFTTVVNLLELCGILSFNLNEKQLTELWFYFQDRYHISVLPVSSLESDFPNIRINDIFKSIKKRSSLGDALMMVVAQKHLPFISTMVSWDKDHMEKTFPGMVLTPDEFLQSPN